MAKRLFDIGISLLGLVLLAPLLGILALWIKLDSPGPVFFRGARVGRGGRLFRIYKFRTMIADAAQRGPGITAAQDPRVTQAGRFLRRFKLDELPQLLNVLKGEMSLVGPRPEDPRYVALYTAEQRRVLDVRPGITGIASLHFRHEEALLSGDDWQRRYIEEIMPQKLALELAYLEHPSLAQDVAILLKTFLALFR
jgi:lipopolysaccharide/colanic/teichoic acid biosynthesis glycosyltransferase